MAHLGVGQGRVHGRAEIRHGEHADELVVLDLRQSEAMEARGWATQAAGPPPAGKPRNTEKQTSWPAELSAATPWERTSQ